MTFLSRITTTGAAMVIHIPKWAIRLSDWIDRRFFPVKNDEELQQLLHERRRKVEEGAKAIRKQIAACETLAQTYTLLNMTANLKDLYGPTAQVVGWVDSLHLEIYRKQQTILDSLCLK